MLSMSMDLTDHAAVIVGRLDGAHTDSFMILTAPLGLFIRTLPREGLCKSKDMKGAFVSQVKVKTRLTERV